MNARKRLPKNWRRHCSAVKYGSVSKLRASASAEGRYRWCVITATAVMFFGLNTTAGQTQQPEWQVQVRKFAEQRDWASALRIVEREIVRTPLDADVLAWRARILMWSGHLADAETEYLKILQISRTDPDNWLGLANVYLREGKTQEALHAVDTAVELDPKRADLRAARGHVLHAIGESKEAQLAFRQALVLDPGSIEARRGLRSFDSETKHELRFGEENDLFNFAGANHDESVNLVSWWSRQWAAKMLARTHTSAAVWKQGNLWGV